MAATWFPTLSLHDALPILRTFPKVRVQTLVIWGMKDSALLPLQLEGLDELVEELTVVRLPAAGHFAPWEAGEAVAEALEPLDRKSTRLNSSHVEISYAVFC